MSDKIRCKARDGRSYEWFVGINKDGKWKAVSVGKPRPWMPMDFAPFPIMDAVMNTGTVFETRDEVETYIRSL